MWWAVCCNLRLSCAIHNLQITTLPHWGIERHLLYSKTTACALCCIFPIFCALVYVYSPILAVTEMVKSLSFDIEKNYCVLNSLDDGLLLPKMVKPNILLGFIPQGESGSDLCNSSVVNVCRRPYDTILCLVAS